MKPLVSIVIPAHNACPWITEAIDSCLGQSWDNLEIIVVNDGSTDDTVSVLKSYENRILWHSQEQSGGSSARNAGFLRSSGEYLQFLDADDYLLPSKIERQVTALIQADTDAAYGDWKHQNHLPDGRIEFGEDVISGYQDDILESLLSGWWVSPAALLFRRTIVEQVGGWDETLPAAQDRDFFSRVAIQTNKITYVPGVEAVYRRYGNVTVSTSDDDLFFQAHTQVTDKLLQIIQESGMLSERYRQATARQYFYLARNLSGIDIQKAESCVRKCEDLVSGFAPTGSYLYCLLFRSVGFRYTEWLASCYRQLKNNTWGKTSD